MTKEYKSMRIKSMRIDRDSPNSALIGEAARMMLDGALAIIPTDTVYGIALAVDAANGGFGLDLGRVSTTGIASTPDFTPDSDLVSTTDPTSVPDFAPGNLKRLRRLSPKCIYEAKARDKSKAVAWLVKGLQSLDDYAQDVPQYACELAKQYWPGALTLVVKANSRVPKEFCAADGSIAVRAPNCAIAQALISACGVPLATSSANIQGQRDVISVNDLDSRLLDHIDLMIDGGKCKQPLPSTVISCLDSQAVVLRKGAIRYNPTQ